MNGKIYIGCHKTKNKDDDYMGSGTVLKRAYKKYGLYNFVKEILFVFDNESDMHAKERELVNDEFLSETNTYNLKVGGSGGWDYVNKTQKNYTNERNKRISPFSNSEKYSKEWHLITQARRTEGVRQAHNEGRAHKFNVVINAEMRLRAETEKAKAKRIETFKQIEHAQESKNSQFGTMWITNDIMNKKIDKSDPIPDNWRKGRVMSSKN